MKNGAWLLTGHREILDALANPALGNAPSRHAVLSARNRERYVSADVAHNILPFMDKPAHIAPRRIIAGAFRAHLKARPPRADDIARRFVSQLAEAGRFDALTDFGKPFSVEVIADMMGLPAEDRPQLCRWSNFFFYLFAPMPSEAARVEVDAALDEFRTYFQALIAARRANPGSDFISRLIVAEDEGERLTEAQLVDTCMLIFADGIENVDAGIANTLLALHRHPAEFERVRADAGLVSAAVQEGLRFDSPAQMIARVAMADIELGGRQIKRDAGVFLALASANRDPAVFADPDRFDLGRDFTPLLSFGKGRHSCIGAPLVRLQIEAALKALFATGRRIEIADRNLEWMPRVGHRWLKRLPVTLA